MKEIISIDIGSTYTKGLRLKEGHGLLVAQERESTATKINLSDSFTEILSSLCNREIKSKKDLPDSIEVFTSSSAKGGLSICAIGLVPDLTLSISRLVALSAGARITSEFAFKLNEDHIEKIETDSPDIILFSGGTDGGNEEYLMHNARLISRSSGDPVILYCGNNALHSKVKELLKNKKLIITENVMPSIDQMNLDPAHDAIRSIFMDTIIQGKGLTRITEITGHEPIPTPLAMMNLCQALYHNGIMDNFAIIDMGGATTDCYSCIDGMPQTDSVILKSIEEPHIKRSVEGDLGMRVSAGAAFNSASQYITSLLDKEKLSHDSFEKHLKKIEDDHSYIPQNKREHAYDRILASAAVYYSITRHSGTLELSYTSSGKRYLQKGKDLRKTTDIIATGGYLSKYPSPLLKAKGPAYTDKGYEILIPEDPKFMTDSSYIFPLLGNCAQIYSEGAALCAKKSLEKIAISPEDL